MALMARILDLTRLYPGGVATRILLDLGFEIVKVEDTKVGDYLRDVSPTLFSLLNSGKKSVSIDLKSAEGREVFYKLVETSDVVIEGFRPGVAERLGVGYEDLRRVNPRVVYCSINGYGSKGPYSGLPGHDINYVSVAGHLDPELFPDKPCVPPVQVADVGSALLCVIGVLGLLHKGTGGRVEISMTEAALLFNLLNISMILDGTEPTLTGKYPFYNIYRCKDGYVSLGALEEKFWANLCRALGREDLIGRQFDKSAVSELEEEFSKYSRSDLLEKLWRMDVPAAPVNSIRDLASDPQLKYRGFSFSRFFNPIVVDGERLGGDGVRPPRRGEHTRELLRELGFSEDYIEDLRRRGIIYF
jgi:alpha-methylacyl-CoA racemase